LLNYDDNDNDDDDEHMMQSALGLMALTRILEERGAAVTYEAV